MGAGPSTKAKMANRLIRHNTYARNRGKRGLWKVSAQKIARLRSFSSQGSWVAKPRTTAEYQKLENRYSNFFSGSSSEFLHFSVLGVWEVEWVYRDLRWCSFSIISRLALLCNIVSNAPSPGILFLITYISISFTGFLHLENVNSLFRCVHASL